MKKETIQKLATGDLKNQIKSKKYFLGLLIFLAIFLASFEIRAMMEGKEFDLWNFIMPLCTLGGGAAVWNEMNLIKEELANRN